MKAACKVALSGLVSGLFHLQRWPDPERYGAGMYGCVGQCLMLCWEISFHTMAEKYYPVGRYCQGHEGSQAILFLLLAPDFLSLFATLTRGDTLHAGKPQASEARTHHDSILVCLFKAALPEDRGMGSDGEGKRHVFG